MSYEPLPPPTVPDLELSRYTYEELIRIAEELRGVTGVDYRTVSRVNKFGYSSSGVTLAHVDVWDGVGATPQVGAWPVLASAETHNIVSSNSVDNQAGTGVRELKITGLSAWDGSEISETISMHPTDGTIAVTTANSYVCIYRIKATDWGTGGANAGNITATASTAGSISAYILASNNQTLMACYALPSGGRAFITKWYASVVASTASRVLDVRLMVHEQPEGNEAPVIKSRVGLDTSGTSYMERNFEPWFEVTGPCLIIVDALASNTATPISAGFDIVLG